MHESLRRISWNTTQTKATQAAEPRHERQQVEIKSSLFFILYCFVTLYFSSFFFIYLCFIQWWKDYCNVNEEKEKGLHIFCREFYIVEKSYSVNQNWREGGFLPLKNGPKLVQYGAKYSRLFHLPGETLTNKKSGPKLFESIGAWTQEIDMRNSLKCTKFDEQNISECKNWGKY